jgi:hypothetical protein
VGQLYKEQAISELLTKVQDLKYQVDAKREEVQSMQSSLEKFQAEFHVYIETLQRCRHDLEKSIGSIRDQIRDWGKPEEAEVEGSTDDHRQQSDKRSQNTVEKYSEQTETDSSRKSKTQALKFFARFWHPDKGTYEDSYLMNQLSAAFRNSQDLADMLSAVPWNDTWLKCGDNESLATQWDRLMDWYTALREADKKMSDALDDLQKNGDYELVKEKEKAEECGEDYFAQLAAQERDEINRLEHTQRTLLKELQYLSETQSRMDG